MVRLREMGATLYKSVRPHWSRTVLLERSTIRES